MPTRLNPGARAHSITMPSYSDTIDYLYGLRLHGIKLGLEAMRLLLRQLGDPHKRLLFIHIAGTNGKGSVAAMLASVFREAGFRTALYTSPHLVSFCERFQINGKPMPEQELVRLVQEMRQHVEELSHVAEIPNPTFFEVTTALAAKYFAEQRADIVIWETGMGGRLDATNVVEPLVSVITSIGLDHTQYLGKTVAEIAREKAGIIKPNVPVVSNVTDMEAATEICEVASQRNSPLIFAGNAVSVERVSESLHGQTLRIRSRERDYGEVQLPLVGDHQIENCKTVITVLETIREGRFAVTTPQVREGLRRTEWQGRFQHVAGKPSFLLDGAHNPHAAQQLRASLEKFFSDKSLTFVLGVLKDKDCAAICQTLAPLANEIFTVRVRSERASDPETLAKLCRAANPSANVRALATFVDAFEAVQKNPATTVVVTGSLFLVGEALQRLDPRHSRVTEKEMTMQ